uniref:Glycosyl transferase n=2 Tax=Caenorhabditis tropicalis TaxID=1561998 RepID=A0A1I7UR21_9PELO
MERVMDKDRDSAKYRFSQDIKRLLADYDKLSYYEASRRYDRIHEMYAFEVLGGADDLEPIDVLKCCLVPMNLVCDLIKILFGYRRETPCIVYNV